MSSKQITIDNIRHISNLARIEVSEEESHQFARQVGDILGYMDMLNKIDTTGVDPTTHAIKMVNAFREDKVIASIDNDLALSNAPEKEAGCFIVPRVV